MGRKIRGVEGVLDELVSGSKQPVGEGEERSNGEQPKLAKGRADHRAEKSNSAEPRMARKGRPPGRTERERRLKKKTSIWISAELMDDYREWSWEERCNLGELIERALVHYQRLRGRTGD